MTLHLLLCTSLLTAASPTMVGAGDEASRLQALVHYRQGQQAFASEDFERAEAEFKAAIRLDPLLFLAHYGLGQVHMSTRSYPEAVRAFTGSREAFHAEESKRLLDATLWNRRLEEQIRAVEDALRGLQAQAPQLPIANAQSMIARIESQLHELKRRRQRGDKVPAPTPPGISIALGSAYFRSGALADAEREYRAALEVNPKLGEAHNNLAVVYLLTGRLDQAQDELRLAEKAGFKVDPGLRQDLKKRMDEAREGESRPRFP